MSWTSVEIDIAISSRRKFGDRIVLEEVDPIAYPVPGKGPNVQRRVKVRCSCGLESEVFWSALKHGRSDRCHTCSMRRKR